MAIESSKLSLFLNYKELADTNAEAAHRRIQTELGMNHSTVWKLIDCFRKVQRTHDAEFDQMISGELCFKSSFVHTMTVFILVLMLISS